MHWTFNLEVGGSSLASLCCYVVSLGKKLYSILSLFTQVYKWVPAIIMLGVTLRWTSIPSRGSTNIPSHFMLLKLELLVSVGLMGHLSHEQITSDWLRTWCIFFQSVVKKNKAIFFFEIQLKASLISFSI